jgi:hypothetical protein
MTTTTTVKTSPANLTAGMMIRTTDLSVSADGSMSALCGSIKRSAPVLTVESVKFDGGQRGHWTTYEVTVTDGRTIRFSNKQKVEVVS